MDKMKLVEKIDTYFDRRRHKKLDSFRQVNPERFESISQEVRESLRYADMPADLEDYYTIEVCNERNIKRPSFSEFGKDIVKKKGLTIAFGFGVPLMFAGAIFNKESLIAMGSILSVVTGAFLTDRLGNWNGLPDYNFIKEVANQNRKVVDSESYDGSNPKVRLEDLR